MKFLLYGAGNAREEITFRKLGGDLKASGSGTVHFALYDRNAFLENHERVHRVRGPEEALRLAAELKPDLVVILSPMDLIAGAADRFRAAGFQVFGVSARLAGVENSKYLAKKLMRRYGVPTPDFEYFTEFEEAAKFLRENWKDGEREFVIKTDRFLANPSHRVTLPNGLPEALESLRWLMLSAEYAREGNPVLLEEKLSGPELSLHLICDGRSYRVMPYVRDYKKLYNGDRGPNTDGIGAVARAFDPESPVHQNLIRRIVEPSLEALSTVAGEEGYRFVLYIGLMFTREGVVALEYNTRPGNPEWAPLLLLLNSPLDELLPALARGELDRALPRFDTDHCALALMATAPSYPFENRAFDELITGLDLVDREIVILSDHMARRGDEFYVNGGRVFGLVGKGTDQATLRASLYENIARVHFKGLYYRDDVGLHEPTALEFSGVRA